MALLLEHDVSFMSHKNVLLMPPSPRPLKHPPSFLKVFLFVIKRRRNSR